MSSLQSGRPLAGGLQPRRVDRADPHILGGHEDAIHEGHVTGSLIAFGIAFIVLGAIMPHDEPDAVRGIVAISSFPVVLGLAYLGLWRFSHD